MAARSRQKRKGSAATGKSPIIGSNAHVGGPRGPVPIASLGDVRAYGSSALRYLTRTFLNEGEETRTRVRAASAVLAHSEFRETLEAGPLRDLAAILGSDENALAWMESKVPVLRDRIAAQRLPVEDARQLVEHNPELAKREVAAEARQRSPLAEEHT